MEAIDLSLKDFGEHALIGLIKRKNPAAIIFFNKTRNKDRGYIERHQFEHSGNLIPTKLVVELIRQDGTKAKDTSK